MGLDELEQFDLLEQKVEALIAVISSLNEQKTLLEGTVKTQQEEIRSLRNEMQRLLADRESVRKRIAGLLEKITECEA